MNFLSSDWRDRRNYLNQGISFSPMHYTIANYSTTTKIDDTTNMKVLEEDILSKIQSIPDPLKKNLADSVITCEVNKKDDLATPIEDKEFYFEPNIPPENMDNNTNGHIFESYPSLTGITNFFSNFFGAISGAMFQRRPKSPVTQYYDCFECDSDVDQKMAASSWHASNFDEQNKKRALNGTSVVDNMSHVRATVAQCEAKLNAVRNILKTKSVPNVSTTKVRYRRPKKAFVEPGAVTNKVEEDFSAENYVSLSNEEYVEYFPIPNNHIEQLSGIDAPIMKTEIAAVPTATEIVNIIPNVIEKDVIKNIHEIAAISNQSTAEISATKNLEEQDEKKEIISSCEDKMAKLKALLQDKKKKPSRNSVKIDPIADKSNSLPPTAVAPPVVQNMAKSSEIPIVTHKPPMKPTKTIPIDKKQDKKFKNPHRLTEKRKKSTMRKNIQDDMVFANGIDSDEISSVDSSPAAVSHIQRIPQAISIPVVDKDSFDELKGKFNSATPESDDSFQIVFTDSPKLSRLRQPSDCDSEDSFIVFEDSPNSCYTSNDVFGDHPSTEDSDLSDSESEISDSGCAADVCKLSHRLSRTVSDLTDDSLYEDSRPIEETDIVKDITIEDEVDCAVKTCDNIPLDVAKNSEIDSVKTGLLIDEVKKLKRKEQPPKKVTFSEKPPKVHVMRVWAFAARQARAGHWERHAVDAERFKRRIADVDMAISWVLKPQHRRRVMFQRFMPWWNQLKRKEAAEKKIRDEENKRRKELEASIEEDLNEDVSKIADYDKKVADYILDVIKSVNTELIVQNVCSDKVDKDLIVNFDSNCISTVET